MQYAKFKNCDVAVIVEYAYFMPTLVHHIEYFIDDTSLWGLWEISNYLLNRGVNYAENCSSGLQICLLSSRCYLKDLRVVINVPWRQTDTDLPCKHVRLQTTPPYGRQNKPDYGIHNLIMECVGFLLFETGN